MIQTEKGEQREQMATGKFISYLRVSTDKQGKSGLGVEAQRQAIDNYLNGGNWKLLKEYIEVESGKRDERPKLKEALQACKMCGATLLIAKLDRLSRNVRFIAELMDSGAEFVACDFPQANRLTIHILAAVAEHEREMISTRTRDALRAAKARGVKLGSPKNLNRKAAAKGRVLGRQIRMAKADEHAKMVHSAIHAYQKEGLSLNSIARKLNEDNTLTPRGKTWTPTAVKRAIERVRTACSVPLPLTSFPTKRALLHRG
jgi:DNA invertase Pin-like site-specific DNA recombinase